MAYTATSFDFRRPSFWAKFAKGFGIRFDNMLNAYARTDQIDALKALSDEQLAAKGLSRDHIVQYVYRDKTHL